MREGFPSLSPFPFFQSERITPMPRIQIAQPPAQEKTAAAEQPAAEKPEVQGATDPQQLSLEELLRIMDVATTLRKEQDVVEEQLNIDQIKARLRERLLEAAQFTGERVTAEQIDVAIDNYYDKLHSFEEPPWSFSVLLAHLYVKRATIIKWAIGIGAVIALLWSLLIVVLLPTESAHPAQTAWLSAATEGQG